MTEPQIDSQSVATGSVADLEGGSGAVAAGPFQPAVGDFVVADGVVARIERYDVAANIVTFVRSINNSVDRVTNHISSTQIHELPSGQRDAEVAQLKLNDSLATTNISDGVPQENVTAGASRVSGTQGDQFIGLDQKPILEGQEQVRASALNVSDEAVAQQGNQSVDDHTPDNSNVAIGIDTNEVPQSKDEHDLNSSTS
jgi:hypothetical protein